MEHTRQLSAGHGYITTLHGRRLYLLESRSRNSAFRKAPEHAVINDPL